MSLSRCFFVYCEQLQKGFITRLTQEQKSEKIYEQVTELFLKETEYEVHYIELMETRPSASWIIPPFFRIKDFADLSFESGVYVRAVLQPKSNDERCSEIRATANYKRSKGGAKRKAETKDVNGEAQEDATGDAAAQPVKKPREADVTPEPEVEKREKSPKRRSSKSSKEKAKVAKAEATKQKLKQSTLTPSSNPTTEAHAAEEVKEKRKTPPITINDKKDDSSDATSTDNDSSTEESD